MRTASYLGDVASFAAKWMVDIGDGQRPDGVFWPTAPAVTMEDIDQFCGDLISNYGVTLPWTIYNIYGDKNILERYYPSMKKYFKYLEDNNDRYIRYSISGEWLEILDNGFTDFDHGWGNTPRDICGTAYFAQIADIMEKTAGVLNLKDDSEYYEGIYKKIKKAFNASFVLSGGRLKQATQTAYVLALAFDLLSGDTREKALENLVSDIRQRGFHPTTGLSGTLFLAPVLSENGYHDIACKIISNDSYPGWGYMVKQGATTIWERWDGLHHREGIHRHPMNSFNHPALGSVGEWFYSYLAGIKAASPGFKEIEIKPGFCAGISRINASYNSIYGKIEVNWKLDGGTFYLDCTIPPNTMAVISIPADDPNSVKEGNRTAGSSQGVTYLNSKNKRTDFRVLSGKYRFRSLLHI